MSRGVSKAEWLQAAVDALRPGAECVSVDEAALAEALDTGQVSAAGGHGQKAPKKVGILLVAFGSSEASAQVSFKNIDKKVKTAYPDIPVRWAYTSHIIRAKLASQGKQLDSPSVALAMMQD